MGRLIRSSLAGVCVLMMAIGFAIPASAQVTLEDVIKRVEALEAENTALRAEVAAMKGKQSVQSVELSEVKAKAVSFSAAPATSSTGNSLKTKPEIELYGFVKADLVISAQDINTTSSGAQAGIAQTNASRPNLAGAADQEVQMSAQDTRLGLNFKAPDLDNGGKLTGKFEMDFSGSVANGAYQPRLRLAYAQIDFEKWAVNAGQNWDIFSPLNPNTLNPGILYREGNLGTRHPQAHLVNKWGEVLGGKLTTRIGVLDSEDTSQEDSGAPVSAAYVGYEKDILGIRSTFGVGGFYGQLNLPGSGRDNGDVYATTAGMVLKFTEWLSFKTEGYVGAGLNKFQGGPPQTTGDASVATTSKALPVKGGFMELTYSPIKKTEFNIGYGVDDVDEDMQAINRVSGTAVWDKNRTVYTNLKYNLSKDLQVGLEFQEFDTKWVDGAKGHNQRIESSLIYKF